MKMMTCHLEGKNHAPETGGKIEKMAIEAQNQIESLSIRMNNFKNSEEATARDSIPSQVDNVERRLDSVRSFRRRPRLNVALRGAIPVLISESSSNDDSDHEINKQLKRNRKNSTTKLPSKRQKMTTRSV